MSTNPSFQKLEIIRVEHRLGVKEFLEKTGISSGAYYNLKEGKAVMTDKIIYKLLESFPGYDYNWLKAKKKHSDLNQDFSKNNKTQDETQINKIAIEAMTNWDKLMNHSTFKRFHDGVIREKFNINFDRFLQEARELNEKEDKK